MSDKTYGLFCRTYHKDSDRLRLLLKSFRRYCTGFQKVVIASPPSSRDAIKPVVDEFEFATFVEVPGSNRDFLGQQITKLTANRYIDTDIITHVDSDCVFISQLTPVDLMRNGRPILYHCSYDYFYRNGYNMPWQGVTSRFLRQQINFEYMRLFPLSYPKELYSDLQDWFEFSHGYPVDFVEPHIHGDEFSEFNIMGAFSHVNGEKYNAHIDSLVEAPFNYVKQFCLVNSREDRALGEDEYFEISNLID